MHQAVDLFGLVIHNGLVIAIGLGAMSLLSAGLVGLEVRKGAPILLLALSLVAPFCFLVNAALGFALGERSRDFDGPFVLVGLLCGPLAAMVLLVASGVAFVHARGWTGLSYLFLCVTNAAIGPVLFFFSMCCS